jgi:predicted ABC-type ATPase
MIQQINDCVRRGESFAFETTFSGKGYSEKIRNWKSLGYEVIIYYLKLPSVDFAIERVRLRVSQGGHNVPEDVIRRRYDRSWDNFQNIYKQLADSWTLFDTSGNLPVAIGTSEVK